MKILLIDDDEDLLAAMAAYFHDHGHEVRCASEAEEAVAMVRHHKFDAVIVDLELSSVEGLDGFGVLKALRQSSPRTHVIVYSGHFGDKIQIAARRHGATRFLAKPASLSELLASVEETCQIPS
jgi:DNA-binding response OmpR family regulator